jgi:dimethylargininase
LRHDSGRLIEQTGIVDRMGSSRIIKGFARQVSRSLPDCALLHLERKEFDLALACRQHALYVSALEQAGLQVTLLPEIADLPDATFVEDAAVLLDEAAVVCRSGTPSREPEAEAIAPVISKILPTRRIIFPGTLEGGDVLRVGRTLFVGLSSRSNQEGICQLESIVTSFGYQVVRVMIRGCLHLKTAVTSPAEGLLIANPAWVDPSPFRDLEILSVPDGEPWGANTLAVNGTVFVPNSAPETARRLRNAGLVVQRLEISELQKAEAGLTCLSLLCPNRPF